MAQLSGHYISWLHLVLFSIVARRSSPRSSPALPVGVPVRTKLDHTLVAPLLSYLLLPPAGCHPSLLRLSTQLGSLVLLDYCLLDSLRLLHLLPAHTIEKVPTLTIKRAADETVPLFLVDV